MGEPVAESPRGRKDGLFPVNLGHRRAWPALLALLLALTAIGPTHAQDVPLPRERPDREAMEAAGEAASPQQEPSPGATAGEGEPGTPTETAAPDAAPAQAPVEAAVEAEPSKPARVFQTACPAVIRGLVEAQMLPPIEEGGCTEQSPLSVTGVLVNGRMVPLSETATANCEMAMTLPAWAEAVDGYVFARENARITRILTGTSYMCRERRTAAGSSDLSEHGLANALDVMGFELADGRSIRVLDGWPDATSFAGRVLRFAHDAACSMFSTTLGPEANALHADHLHLDQGCHGKTCTARLCE